MIELSISVRIINYKPFFHENLLVVTCLNLSGQAWTCFESLTRITVALHWFLDPQLKQVNSSIRSTISGSSKSWKSFGFRFSIILNIHECCYTLKITFLDWKWGGWTFFLTGKMENGKEFAIQISSSYFLWVTPRNIRMKRTQPDWRILFKKKM